MANFPLLSFSAGELSPQIDSRSDIDKYRAGCRTLENMIPRIYGPATRRPGTKYIDTCNGVSRVIPFIYSNTVAYILLLEDQRMWFYYDGGRVLGADGRRYGIDTPYLAADLFQLQYKQSNDVMWIVHPAYAPRKLTRVSANEFSLDTITFTTGPFKKRNDLAEDDGVTLTPSAITGNGTLTASSATFDSDHVGALFSITQPRVNTSVSGELTSTGVLGGSSILTEGPCTLNISSGWAGTIELQRSIDDGVTWETRRSFYSDDGQRAIQYSFNEEEDDVLHRVYVSAYEATYEQWISTFDEDGYDGERQISRPSRITGDLTVDSSTQTGRCRITGYVSSTSVTMTVLKGFASTDASTRWAEGCWSRYRGWPHSVTFFEERCVYAGTAHQPQTIWLSATDDYEYFSAGTNDDNSFALTISSETRNAIQWIGALEALVLGTSGGEWRIGTSADNEPLTPTNYTIKQQTNYGSKDLQALPVGDAILFTDFVGRRVREVAYSNNYYKYLANDLSALAEHITETGIVGMAFQRNPDPILWCFRTDGVLLSMTYEREQNVIGWARHPFFTGEAVEGGLAGGTYTGEYPTLQELTSAEIPTAESEPSVTAGATAVSNAVELQAMNGSNTYYLTNDIDLTGVTWTPIVGFSGVLDGGDYTISNLTINSPATNGRALFFTTTAGAQIYDLTIDGFNITGSWYTSALVGQITGGSCVFKNITFNNCTIAGNSRTGCLCGYFQNANGDAVYNCNVTDCDVSMKSGSEHELGGLIGFITTKSNATAETYITNCSVDGDSTVKWYGSSSSVISSSTHSIGGLCGTAKGDATVPSSLYLTFHSCHSDAVLSSMGYAYVYRVGGFVGYVDYPVKFINCYAAGDITVANSAAGAYHVGGFVGNESTHTTYLNSYCTGNISLTTSADVTDVGGFGGYFDYTVQTHILRCYTTSDITIDTVDVEDVGGFIGYTRGLDTGTGTGALIERSWAEGDIDIAATNVTNVGGFIGLLNTIFNAATSEEITIQNCYSWSEISTSSTYVAGFIGATAVNSAEEVTLTNCYSAQTDTAMGSGFTNAVPSGDDNGGFVAYEDTADSIVLTASFWDTETSGHSTSLYGTGHITDWMQTKSNYEGAGWDFDTIWILNEVDTTYDYTSSGLGCNSVAVIPSSTEDEVWVVVTRVINGSAVRYLEQMQPRDWSAGTNDDTDQWFVDSGLDYDSTAATTFSGLDHLEGETVAVLADGACVGTHTVTNGSITLTNSASRVIVGLPFRYKLKPMRIDFTTGTHTSQTAIKHIGEVIVSFYKSGMVEFGTDTDHLIPIAWRTTEALGTPPALFTGDKVLNPEGGFDADDSFILTGGAPVNATVRAIIPRVTVTGR